MPRRRARRGARARCPTSPPEHGEPFADVLRDLDELIAAGAHALEPPALLRLVREHRLRAGHPRRAADRGAERERDDVVDLAGRDRARAVTVLDWLAQLLGLPRGWHGHIEDTASTSTLAALAAARTLRPGGVVYASEQANFTVEKAARLLGLEFRTVPVDDEFRMRTDFPLDDATAVVATVGTTRRRRSTRCRSSRDRCERGRRVAARRRGVRRLGARSAPSCAGASTAATAPTRSSSTRTSGCSRRWTARRSGRGGPRRCTRRSRACRDYLASTEDAIDLQGLRPGARPALPRAQALDGAALVRRARACRR